MVLEVKKQERETGQALIRRFTKKVQRSGILRRARKTRFHHRSKSRQMKKRQALRMDEKRKEYEKIKKSGELKA